MPEKILFVDDDPNILASFQRGLRGVYQVEVAQGPEIGLELIRTSGPYSVVVSDLRMPGMSGIQFLTHVCERAPDSVRVMLTGNADVEAAIASVNEGNIFRFLTKPVDHEILIKALDASVKQYRLEIAERELLQKTLAGSVDMLVDLLSLANPMAFSKSSRISRHVKRIAQQMGIRETWQFELAAMLSQIGCVAIAPDLIEKIHSGKPLTPDEKAKFQTHPDIARKLLANIPRLEMVAEIIARQFDTSPASDLLDPSIKLGASILRTAMSFDDMVSRGIPATAAISELSKCPERHDPRVVSMLDSAKVATVNLVPKVLRIADVQPGMLLDQDVWTTKGTLLASTGYEVTNSIVECLKAWATRGEITGTIKVRVRA